MQNTSWLSPLHLLKSPHNTQLRMTALKAFKTSLSVHFWNKNSCPPWALPTVPTASNNWLNLPSLCWQKLKLSLPLPVCLKRFKAFACAWAACPAAVNLHNILTGNAGPPIMELELATLDLSSWNWNLCSPTDILLPLGIDVTLMTSSHTATAVPRVLNLHPTAEPSAHPLDEGKDSCP